MIQMPLSRLFRLVPTVAAMTVAGLIFASFGLAPCWADNGQLVRTSGVSVAANQTPSATAASSTTNAQAKVPADALRTRLRSGDEQPQAPERESASSFSGMLPTVIGALAITLGLFCIWVAIMRRGGLRSAGRGLPREAVEVIGQTMIGPNEKLLVVRCGLQALVVGVTPAGMQTLAQFEDPDEAGQFIASCRGTSATRSFQRTLSELEREPANGFVDSDAGRSDGRPGGKAGRLFLRA